MTRGTEMESRRRFIGSLGLGVISATALASSSRGAQKPALKLDRGTGKRIRIGIIGAENSHTVGLGKAFNVRKEFPGVEVVALWGETPEFAQRASDAGSIPKIVDSQTDLLGLVDAVIIDHRHAKYHAEAAIPFIEHGIPTFVDKPFTYRWQEGRALLDLAEKHKTPITCLSSVGFGPTVDDMTKQVSRLDEITSIIVTGPADIDSKYGGIFFYGVHTVERLFKVFGDDAIAVRATRHGTQVTFQFKFRSGRLATAILASKWEVFCLTGEGMTEIKPLPEADDQVHMYSAIVKMFQTGEEPRSHESILRTVAALEAMERSVGNEQWEYLVA